MSLAARRTLGALLCAAAVAVAAFAADEPKATFTLEPDPIGREELATLTLVVETSGLGGVAVEPDFRLDNLRVAAGPFRSSSQSWVNGVTSSSVQLVWRLQPLGTGPAAVRSVRVTAGGRSVALPDATIEVVAEAPPRAAPRQRQDPLDALFGNDPFRPFAEEDPFRRFRGGRRAAPRAEPQIRALVQVEPATVRVGEQLAWRVVLETQTEISQIDPKQLPDFRGFWAQDASPTKSPTPTLVDVNGERFARVPILEKALFPLEPGEKRLAPVELTVVARFVDPTGFGPFGEDRRVELRTEARNVTVRPLPPAPAEFSGVVGRLELSAALDAAEVETGQAASLTVEAKSDGNLQSIEPPVLAWPEGVRSFPPTRESSERIAAGRVTTTVRWKYVLLADRAGRYPAPAIELVHFDPTSDRFRTARAAPFELAVRAAKGASAEPAPTPAAEVPTEAAQARGLELPWRTLGTAGALLAGLAGLAALFARQRRKGRPAAELRRALAAAKLEPSPRTAAALVEEGWRSFLDARYAIPRSLPTAQWAERLAVHGVAATSARELETLFEELHFLAYAPELAELEAHRTEILERSARLLRRLS